MIIWTITYSFIYLVPYLLTNRSSGAFRALISGSTFEVTPVWCYRNSIIIIIISGLEYLIEYSSTRRSTSIYSVG